MARTRRRKPKGPRKGVRVPLRPAKAIAPKRSFRVPLRAPNTITPQPGMPYLGGRSGVVGGTRPPAAYTPPPQAIGAPVSRAPVAPPSAQGLPFDGSYEERIAALGRDRDLTQAELLHRGNSLRYEYGFDDMPNPFARTGSSTQPVLPVPSPSTVQPTPFPTTPSVMGGVGADDDPRAGGVSGGVYAPQPSPNGVTGGVYATPNSAFGGRDEADGGAPLPTAAPPDPSNPFSRAAMLQRAYQQSQAATRGNRASQGQLYSGALQSDLDESRFGYDRNVDTERRSYAEALNALTQQQARATLGYETGVAAARRDRIEGAARAT